MEVRKNTTPDLEANHAAQGGKTSCQKASATKRANGVGAENKSHGSAQWPPAGKGKAGTAATGTSAEPRTAVTNMAASAAVNTGKPAAGDAAAASNRSIRASSAATWKSSAAVSVDMGCLGFGGGHRRDGAAQGQLGPNVAPAIGEQVFSGDFAARESLDSSGVFDWDRAITGDPSSNVRGRHPQMLRQQRGAPASTSQPCF